MLSSYGGLVKFPLTGMKQMSSAEVIEEYRENPTASAWVMAHAGSGKTYALIRRVIALLLHGAKPQTIWCLTYTNNAAAEMQSRLLDKLETLSAMDDAALATELEVYLDIAAPVAATMLARLRALAKEMAMPGGSITCTTMHGLCQQLLRIFAFETGLLPDFSILTAEEAKNLVFDAVEDVFANAIDEAAGDLYTALDYVSSTNGYDVVKQRLKKMLERSDLLKNALSEAGGAAALSQEIYTLCGVAEHATLHALLQAAHRDTPTFIEQALYAYKAGGPADLKKAAPIQQWLAVDKDDASALKSAWQAYMGVFLTKEEKPRSRLFNKDTIEAGSPLADGLYREQLRVQQIVEKIGNLAFAQDAGSMLHLANAVLDRYAARKAEPGLLDFDDLLHLVASLLKNTEMTGHVMQRLDYRVEHILLDEAQDTSPLQWQILSNIIEELCATDPRNSTVPRSVFVVGDIKQSIYSFQGAAPEMMLEKRAYFKALYEAHGQPFNIGALATARRSTADILKLVDIVAAQPAVRAGIMEENVCHKPYRIQAEACIGVFPVIEGDIVEKPENFHMPVAYYTGSKAHNKLAKAIATHVQNLLQGGQVLPSTNQPVTAADIMVIVRNRGKLVPALIRAFEEVSVPVEGIDKLKLAEHILVKDVLALIRFIYQPEDDVSLAQILRSPMLGLSEEALFQLAYGRKAALYDALLSAADHAQAVQWLEMVMQARHLPIYDWLHMLFYQYGLTKKYRARLGEEVQEIIDSLMDFAASLHGRVESSLLYFLQHLTQSEHMLERASGAKSNAVRILTVHGAKGLESPVVILADTTSMANTNKEEVFNLPTMAGLVPLGYLSEEAKKSPVLLRAKQATLERLTAEYYRTLYVALTRAQDMLLVFGAKPKSEHDGHWHSIIKTALSSMPETTTDEQGVLWLRTATKLVQDATYPQAVAQNTQGVPAWLHQAVEVETAPKSISPSRLIGEGNTATPTAVHGEGALRQTQANIIDARQYGIALHAVLQWVKPDTPQHIIVQALMQYGLDVQARDLAVSTIKQIFNQEYLAQLWQLPAHCEQVLAADIQVNGALYPVSGVVDRVIETPDGLLVMDYKTSLSPPEPAAIPESYIMQMQLYAHMLQMARPDMLVHAALLWTHIARLDRLDALLNGRALEEITRNLTDAQRLIA